MTQIYACSSNPGKLSDFQLVARELSVIEWTLVPLPRLKEITAPEETGATFEENASLKALYYSQFTDGVVLADDSGLEVDALAGAPGVHSARYAGLHATDAQNNSLLLENMSGIENRRARFVGSIALARRGRILHAVRAEVEGEILDSPRGTGGFGYDPLFFYPPFQCSFGDLDDVRRFAVSHRGTGLRQVVRWIGVSGIA